jgi:hypothetical protein
MCYLWEWCTSSWEIRLRLHEIISNPESATSLQMSRSLSDASGQMSASV